MPAHPGEALVSVRLYGLYPRVVADAVDYCLATLIRTRSLKLKIHMGVVHDTHQEQLVSGVIAKERAYESAVAWARHVRRYLDRKAHRAGRGRDRFIGAYRTRREHSENDRGCARSGVGKPPEAFDGFAMLTLAHGDPCTPLLS